MTVPVGVPTELDTVAVNFTDLPDTDVFWVELETRDVEVLAWLTVCIRALLELLSKIPVGV